MSRVINKDESAEHFFRRHFGSHFEKFSNLYEKIDELQGMRAENDIYFNEKGPGGYSSLYCSVAWDDESLQNDADLAIFNLLFEIDLENDAETTIILNNLCIIGAFGAVKVRANWEIEIQFHFRK